MKLNSEGMQILYLILIFLVVAIGGWVTFSYFEAKSYNNLTGNNVSTWNAMFLDLRVQDTPQKGV